MDWLGLSVGGLLGTLVMTTLMEGGQFFRITRMSLPFMLGTYVTENRTWAKVWGFVFHFADGIVFAIGYALGRIGCFLVGDDYGAPTSGWWGIAFPKGSPPTTAYALREFGVRVSPSIPDDAILKVHPTQIYESLSAFVMFAILMRVESRPHKKGRAFGLFLILMGIERFLVEIVRAKDDRFLGPFTVAQLISVVIVVIGIVLIGRAPREIPGASARH